MLVKLGGGFRDLEVRVIETRGGPKCPGYCLAQDTFYVGTLKGAYSVKQLSVRWGALTS